MPSPKEVVNKWVDAFNVGDVDMIITWLLIRKR